MSDYLENKADEDYKIEKIKQSMKQARIDLLIEYIVSRKPDGSKSRDNLDDMLIALNEFISDRRFCLEVLKEIKTLSSREFEEKEKNCDYKFFNRSDEIHSIAKDALSLLVRG